METRYCIVWESARLKYDAVARALTGPGKVFDAYGVKVCGPGELRRSAGLRCTISWVPEHVECSRNTS